MIQSGDDNSGENGRDILGEASPPTDADQADSDPKGAGDAKPQPDQAPQGAPRNPWQAPRSGQKGAPRKSASIDHIFRPRRDGPPPPGQGKVGGGIGGGRIGGPSFRVPAPPGGGSWMRWVVGGVVVAWLMLSTSHQLASNEEGLVTTFGKYTTTIGPGMNFTAPWPIQQVRVEDVTSIQRETVPDGDGENLMLTGDQSLVNLSYLVRWNIKNLKQYAYQMKDPKGTVIEVAEAAMRATVGETSIGQVIGGNGRAEIEAHVRQRMQAVLDAYHSGVLVQGVDITKADPPAKVNAAFLRVQGAQQDATRDYSKAQTYARTVIAKAEGEAATFEKLYEQYKLAPEVTRRRLYYATMEGVLQNNDKVIVPQNGVTSYLPLPAIQKKPDAASEKEAGR